MIHGSCAFSWLAMCLFVAYGLERKTNSHLGR